MTDISFPIALWAGLLSFFAPCVVPLFPSYIAYITGDSIKHIGSSKESNFKKRVLFSSLMYILGFSLMFMLLGSTIAGAGIIVRKHMDVVRLVGGLLIIIFGLEMAKFVRISFLGFRETKVPGWVEKLGVLRPFFIGVIFATTWAPCVGPILGSILALSFIQTTATYGALLLFTYSLGISIPFLFASLIVLYFGKAIKISGKKLNLISRVSGILMIVLGVLLVTNRFGYVNAFFGNLF